MFRTIPYFKTQSETFTKTKYCGHRKENETSSISRKSVEHVRQIFPTNPHFSTRTAFLTLDQPPQKHIEFCEYLSSIPCTKFYIFNLKLRLIRTTVEICRPLFILVKSCPVLIKNCCLRTTGIENQWSRRQMMFENWGADPTMKHNTAIMNSSDVLT